MSFSTFASALAPVSLLRAALPVLACLAAAGPASAAENYVFSVSWEPAFCETHMSKPECQNETSSDFAASNFSLHGLWPQAVSYCGVSSTDKYNDTSGQWSLLPAVLLDASTRSWLDTDMPGTQSYLERHEWIKHGTCSGESQQSYFSTALSILYGVNNSNLAAEVRSDIGYVVPLSYLKQAARLDYGSAADNDMEYLCTSINGYQYLTEIRFHLALPQPLPGQILPEYLATPSQRASSSQLCGSNVVIDWVQP